MAQSNYVFESGEGIRVGNHGDTKYLFHSGEPVPNTGESEYVFESGIGLGGLGDLEIWVFVDTTGSSDVINEQKLAGKNLIDYLANEYGADGLRAGVGAIGPGVPVEITQGLTEDLNAAKSAIDNLPTGGNEEEYNEAAVVGATHNTVRSEADVVCSVYADDEEGDTSRSVSEIISDLRNSTGAREAVVVGQDRYSNGELTDLGNQYEYGEIRPFGESQGEDAVALLESLD